MIHCRFSLSAPELSHQTFYMSRNEPLEAEMVSNRDTIQKRDTLPSIESHFQPNRTNSSLLSSCRIPLRSRRLWGIIWFRVLNLLQVNACRLILLLFSRFFIRVILLCFLAQTILNAVVLYAEPPSCGPASLFSPLSHSSTLFLLRASLGGACRAHLMVSSLLEVWPCQATVTRPDFSKSLTVVG